MKHVFFATLIFSSLILSACSGNQSQTPTSTPVSSQPITQEATGYPNPSETNSPYPQVNTSPYPGADTDYLVATPCPIPSPGQETSVVTGRFLGDSKPVPNAILYLAEVKKGENGQELMAAYSEISSPRAYTDRDGQFVFSNVPPGKYGLVLTWWQPNISCTNRRKAVQNYYSSWKLAKPWTWETWPIQVYPFINV